MAVRCNNYNIDVTRLRNLTRHFLKVRPETENGAYYDVPVSNVVQSLIPRVVGTEILDHYEINAPSITVSINPV